MNMPVSNDDSHQNTMKATHPEPIGIRRTGQAHLLFNLHPLLILTLLYFRFGALVRNPVSGLLGSLILLAGLQIGYVTACLPVAGRNGRALSTASEKAQPQQPKRMTGRKRIHIHVVHGLVVGTTHCFHVL